MTSTTIKHSAADIVFEQLSDQIMSLEILPGQKLSEAEIAAKFGISRQPVREAFALLDSMALLEVQPQKATRVRRFSVSKIEEARFARLALEIEICKTACAHWSGIYRPAFQRCLDAQDKAALRSDAPAFHGLDEDFHSLIADAAQLPFATAQLKQYKTQADRICILSLQSCNEISDLISDHKLIYDCLMRNAPNELETHLRTHLSRLTKTVAEVRAAHPEFFEE
ncbi:GntR family transcriptional regulator [uncultured Tateyamaria sp.]|uniref:GntR family transcriptional regulator n=1 Tax=uncultured Tateyamaria sp. TaxID=455651 RepID=UPI00262A6AE8|nr:GntR family transcriptional regulator [uncultured Tateyamaria sp.]